VLVGQNHGRLAAAVGGGLLDGGVDLSNPAIEVSHDTRLDAQASLYVRRLARHSQVAGQGMLDVGARQEAVDADRVEHHQDGDEGGPGEFQDACSGALMPQPRDSRQLSDLEGNAQPDDGPERAGEY